ncbi:non-canonical purine NTP pyrophosphatase [Campylobacter vicugnae]|uniref:non-canonical purine NTP pyrophosphatase n=1 Tax=Campylobacter vicugnae TaxID=1660076 RepID=UPI00254B82C8|nr:non-canonical purine NTP pyrophosphatase [Campylobacter ovis]MDL0105152.1 non-canonical purine NTP pyrophosphatase [Campylobacter ovis]MDL0106571.1 non-canonical purine NTP pyrophosphatase [Campylobacter ovis]
MKIVLATNNMDKVREIKAYYTEFEVVALKEICKPFEIEENGISFYENAMIKASAVYARVKELGLENEYIALSDDSGISVDALGGRPGIYSARYSGESATDASNRAKLITELNKLGLSQSNAFYTACIGICSKFGEYGVHGFMHGKVIDKELGSSGFGYDFMFIPNGFDKTVGQLDESIKLQISHRSKGLRLAKPVLRVISRYYS